MVWVRDCHGGMQPVPNSGYQMVPGASPQLGDLRAMFSGFGTPREAVGSDTGKAIFHLTVDAEPYFPSDSSIIVFHKLALPHVMSELAAAYNMDATSFLDTWTVFPVDLEGLPAPVTLVAEEGVVLTSDTEKGLTFSDGWRFAWLEKQSPNSWMAKGDLVSA